LLSPLVPKHFETEKIFANIYLMPYANGCVADSGVLKAWFAWCNLNPTISLMCVTIVSRKKF